MKISAVLTVLNEEKHIESCLESLSFADEIIIVDDGSIDKTIAIAKKYTSKIYHHKSAGFVEPARNFSIQKATGDWIFIIDADEAVPNTLGEKLKQISKQSEYSAVEVPRKNIIFSRWILHSGWWPDYNIRFFKKGAVTWKNEIHSKPIVEGNILELESVEEFALIHENYTSVTEFLTKLNAYTTIEVGELEKKGIKFSLPSIVTKPDEEFLSRFFAREGYKDGLHGLTLSILEAFSSFIVQMKLWEKTGFEEKSYEEYAPEIKKQVGKQLAAFAYWTTTISLQFEKNVLRKYLLKAKRKLSK